MKEKIKDIGDRYLAWTYRNKKLMRKMAHVDLILSILIAVCLMFSGNNSLFELSIYFFILSLICFVTTHQQYKEDDEDQRGNKVE